MAAVVVVRVNVSDGFLVRRLLPALNAFSFSLPGLRRRPLTTAPSRDSDEVEMFVLVLVL